MSIISVIFCYRAKLVANWILGDIAAYLKDEKALYWWNQSKTFGAFWNDCIHKEWNYQWEIYQGGNIANYNIFKAYFFENTQKVVSRFFEMKEEYLHA
jgi:hypothetical protein